MWLGRIAANGEGKGKRKEKEREKPSLVSTLTGDTSGYFI